MGLISKNTAMRIALAYQEIERGEQLLTDVRQALAQRKERWPDKEEDLRDALGYRHRDLQLGVATGHNTRQLIGVSYELSVPVIEVHIANERAQLAALSAVARSELDAPPAAVEPKGEAA
jgi:hypothetical protein